MPSTCLSSVALVVLLAATTAAADVIDPTTYDHPVRVACVDDSITFGVGTRKPAEDGYPARLQAILGPRWDVRNFGVGGRTMLRATDPLDFRPALASKPDVVIILLGTNDSKLPAWKAHKDEFAVDYAAAVKQFHDLPSHPRIWAGLPTPAFPGNWGITEDVIHGEVLPAIKTVAAQAGIPVIDLHEPLLGEKARFPDLVHPDAEGAKRIAALVAAAIAGTTHP